MDNKLEVEVTIHQAIKNGWRMKVSIPSLGLYINGFRAHPSKKEPGEWAIFPPSQKVGSRWVNILEFDSSLPLWKEIEEVARKAVSKREEVEALLVEKEETIDVADIPFP